MTTAATTANARDASSSGFPGWWRIGGACGVLWVVLFFVGISMQGDSPGTEASVAEIRDYFVNDGQSYLVGDYLIGLGFILGFFPFFVALSRYIGRREGPDRFWSTLVLVGGVAVVLVGAASSAFQGALALGLKDNPDLDDATIRLMMDANAYAFSSGGIAFTVFLGGAGIGILQTRAFPRGVGVFALVLAVIALVGAAWPIDGNEDGFLGILGFAAFALTGVFALITGIMMLLKKELPDAS